LAFIPLILVVLLLLAVVWIIIPAPNRYFWLWAIGVGEWSLWFGALALLSIIAAVLERYLAGYGSLWITTIALGAAVISLTLYPFFSTYPLARKNKVRLSLRKYFNGLPAKDHFVGFPGAHLSTHIFSSFDGNDLRLDVCPPTVKNENNGAAVIVVHGGSWSGGTRSDFPRWNKWLAAQGYTVFDIDYRLAQPNYLTATEDVKTAVRWVKTHSQEFGIDPERIALLGRSAGGHLALQAAYSAAGEAERVRAVVSFYAPIDLLWAYGIPANKKVHDGPMALINFLGGRPGESDEMRERYLSASSISHVTESTPPTFLAHGGRDRVVYWKNMHRLKEKLDGAQVPHEIYLIPYGQHGFDYNINGWGSQATASLMLRFLAKHLRPR
jgi:acetyl esterase/lipase